MDTLIKLKFIEELKPLLKSSLESKVATPKVYIDAKFMKPSFSVEDDVVDILVVTTSIDADFFDLSIAKDIRPVTSEYNLNVSVSCMLPSEFEDGAFFGNKIYVGTYG